MRSVSSVTAVGVVVLGFIWQSGNGQARADEGGVSFWLPGQYGSFGAMASNPGWSFETIYYRQSPSAQAGVNFTRGGGLQVGVKSPVDLVMFTPTYTFETPIFGARDTAEDASDWLRAGSYAVYGAAGLAAPAPEDAWLAAKAKGFAVGGGALLATWGATEGLKAAVGRERPIGRANDSFPSNHASMTAVSARLAHETLNYYDLPPAARVGSDVGLAGLVLAAGWARVEAGRHHPADVLAGMALGNFLAVFASEAFLAPATEERLQLGLRPHGDGMLLQLRMGF